MVKLAALDLGSNSFHLLDALCHERTLQFGTRLKEKVQIGAGLDIDRNLSQTAINRSLDCIRAFQSHIKEQNIQHIVAVATNALRIAHNRHDFIHAAEAILGTSINVIHGTEEARLIFHGAINEIEEEKHGLVIDIGGGSTEFAIGDNSELMFTASLEMGCVSYYQRFFADGKIYSENVRAAEKAASLELEPHLGELLSNNHQWITGTSGTIQSIAELTQHFCGDPVNILRRSSIDDLEKRLILTGHVKALNFKMLDTNRCEILPAGLAIIRAIFNALDIEEIRVCHSALCEGLLLELHDKTCH